MWFLTVLGRKNARFFARSSLGIKDFLFRMAQTIISSNKDLSETKTLLKFLGIGSAEHRTPALRGIAEH